MKGDINMLLKKTRKGKADQLDKKLDSIFIFDH
jgi:hypothetical protein